MKFSVPEIWPPERARECAARRAQIAGCSMMVAAIGSTVSPRYSAPGKAPTHGSGRGSASRCTAGRKAGISAPRAAHLHRPGPVGGCLFGGMRAVAHVTGLPCEAWISVATAPRGQTDNAPQSGLTVLPRNRLCPKQKRAKMCQQGAKDRAGSGRLAVVSCIFGRLIVSGFAKADAGHSPKIPLNCAGAPPFGLARRPPYPQEWRRLPGLFPDGERGLTIFPCPALQKANRKYGKNPAQSVPEMAPIWRDQANFLPGSRARSANPARRRPNQATAGHAAWSSARGTGVPPVRGLREFCVLVPKVGVEPTRHCWRGILNPLRLPFRHLGHADALTKPGGRVNNQSPLRTLPRPATA